MATTGVRKRRIRRWLVWAGVPLLALALACVVLRLTLGVRDRVGWIDADRKTVGPIEVRTPEPNAFYVYERAVEALPAPSERVDSALMRYGDDPASVPADVAREAEAVVRDGGPALDLLHEGAACDYASPYASMPPDSAGGPVGGYGGYRMLARLASLKAASERALGRDAEGLRVLADAHALGVALTQDGETMSIMVGLAVCGIAHERAARILSGTSATPPELLEHARSVRTARERVGGLSLCYQRELASSLWTLDRIQGYGLVLGSGAHWGGLDPVTMEQKPRPPRAKLAATWLDLDETRVWLTDRTARLMEEADKSPSERHMHELLARTSSDIAARRDPWADMVAAPFTLEGVYGSWVRVQGILVGEEVMAALAAYCADNGHYPESLDDLVPGYLPDVPSDPWTGEPLIYRRDGSPYTLYARGDNQADDGGSREQDMSGRVPGYPADQVFMPLAQGVVGGSAGGAGSERATASLTHP